MSQTDAQSVEHRDLIIDFGGVITYSIFERCRDIEQLYRLPDGSLNWTGPFDPLGDGFWQQYLSGQISERDYWYTRCGELGQILREEITIRRLVTDLRNFKPSVRPEAETLIRQARAQGRRVGLLTNELELFHGPEVYDAFEILGSFDAIVDATHTGILKPEPRAYQLAVESLDASFESVVFVDDQQKNIDGAIDCGIEAIRLDITEPEIGFDQIYQALGVTLE
jgi:putative hydrolase of the HAD superfamily